MHSVVKDVGAFRDDAGRINGTIVAIGTYRHPLDFGNCAIAVIDAISIYTIRIIVDINCVTTFPTRITVAVDEDLGGLIDDGRECDGVLIFLASGHEY